MAVGDVVANIVSVAAGGSIVIQPAAGVEWLITNIYIPDGNTSLELYKTDGTTDIKILSLNGSLLNYNFYLTNTYYLKIVNTDTANAYSVGYDGVQTR